VYDVILQAPDDIDDDRLNEWLASDVAPLAATSATQVLVELVAGRDYVLPYGLALGARRASRLHPNLPLFALDGVTLDMNGATIHIPDWDTDDPRTRYGVPAMHALWARGTTVSHGIVRGGLYGLIALGCEQLIIDAMDVADVELDFVYLQSGDMDLDTGDRELNRQVLVNESRFQNADRQGFVLNGVDGFELRGCDVRAVEHCVFDVEPKRSGQCTGVYVHDNDLPQGGLAFVNYPGGPALAPLGEWRFIDNRVNGHLRVRVEPTVDQYGQRYRHAGFSFCRNTNVHPDRLARPYANQRKALVRVCGWDGVLVTDNDDTVTDRAMIFALNDCTAVTDTPNAWRVTAA
jgi:hypothetical protein